MTPAVDYALSLQTLSEEMNTSFSATREISAEPMRAVMIYQNIVDGFVEAEAAARNANIIASEIAQNIIIFFM